MHRSWLALGGVVVALLLTGCGSPSVEQSSSLSSGAPVAYTTPPRAAAPIQAKGDPVDPSSTFKLVTALQGFGLDLLRAEAKAQPEGNIVLSPASIHDALSMTANGASGQTAKEMLHALRLDALGLPKADSAWAWLIASAEGNPDAEVRIANSLWLRKGVAFRPDFLKTNRDYFAADAAPLPDDPAGGASQINDWVAERTGGRIQELVGPIDPSTRLVLVNALYVKAGWDHFKTGDTKEGPFNLSDGQQVQVPMMHGQIGTNVTETSDYVAVPIEANGELSVTIVLPKSGRSPESVLPALANGGLEDLSSDMKSKPYIVDLALPRFSARFKDTELASSLEAMGMRRAFTPSAQFDGIAPGPLWIDEVVHEAVLDLNEQGVEAAAGTAVIMDGAAPPTEHLRVTVDRPFIVLLSTGSTDVPLFMAIVRDPR